MPMREILKMDTVWEVVNLKVAIMMIIKVIIMIITHTCKEII